FKGMWEPASGRFLRITDIAKPHGGTIGDEKYAIIFNPFDYEPQSKYLGDKDAYIMDLATGKVTLVLKKHTDGQHNLYGSPGGKYITYLKEKDWYVYDILNNSHTRVSTKIPQPMVTNSRQLADGENGYGIAGWTTGDKSLLIYDEYDIWEVVPDGSHCIRLTDGREQGIKFRIIPEKMKQRRTNDMRASTLGEFNLIQPLLLNATSVDNMRSGFYQWQPNKKMTRISY